MENIASQMGTSWASGQKLGGQLVSGGGIKAVLGAVATIGGGLALPWRLVTHQGFGERTLTVGCPLAGVGLALGFGATGIIVALMNAPTTIKTAIGGGLFGGGQQPAAVPPGTDFDFILRWIPVLMLIWLSRLLYIWQIEKTGPRPLSWSMGGLPTCGTDLVGMTISNIVAAVVGLWVLVFCHDFATSMIFFVGAVGGQIGEFATWLQIRWQVLDARDQQQNSEAMQNLVGVTGQANGEPKTVKEIFV